MNKVNFRKGSRLKKSIRLPTDIDRNRSSPVKLLDFYWQLTERELLLEGHFPWVSYTIFFIFLEKMYLDRSKHIIPIKFKN